MQISFVYLQVGRHFSLEQPAGTCGQEDAAMATSDPLRLQVSHTEVPIFIYAQQQSILTPLRTPPLITLECTFVPLNYLFSNYICHKKKDIGFI